MRKSRAIFRAASSKTHGMEKFSNACLQSVFEKMSKSTKEELDIIKKSKTNQGRMDTNDIQKTLEESEERHENFSVYG